VAAAALHATSRQNMTRLRSTATVCYGMTRRLDNLLPSLLPQHVMSVTPSASACTNFCFFLLSVVATCAVNHCGNQGQHGSAALPTACCSPSCMR
jgi:hypothetical protein